MRTDTIAVMNHLNVFMFHGCVEDVTRWEAEGKGKAKRKNHRITAFTLNQPEALPSSSDDNPATITPAETRANAGETGTLGYQHYVKAKVQLFGKYPSWAYPGAQTGWSDRVVSA